MATSYSWIKLYHEMLEDPKMGRLSDHLYRRCVEIFLMAGRFGQTGALPPEFDMCWTLRADPAQLRADLEELQRVDIVYWNEQWQCWVVRNFVKRQASTPSAQRVQDFRKRKKTNSGSIIVEEAAEDEPEKAAEAPVSPPESNGVVTDRYKSNVTLCNGCVTEPVRESSSSSSSSSNSLNIFKLYESEIGMITVFISDQLKAAEEDYPPEWLERAVHEAARQNKRSWAYVSAILKRWETEGFDGSKPPGNGNGNGKNGGVKLIMPTQEEIDFGRKPTR